MFKFSLLKLFVDYIITRYTTPERKYLPTNRLANYDKFYIIHSNMKTNSLGVLIYFTQTNHIDNTYVYILIKYLTIDSIACSLHFAYIDEQQSLPTL